MNLPNPESKPDPQKDGGPPVISFGKTTIFDKPVDTNVATAACYVPIPPLNIVAAVLVFMSPSDNNRYARFHAVQSGLLGIGLLVVTGVLNAVTGTLAMIPLINLLAGIVGLVSLLLYIGYFAFSAKLAYDCYRGQNTRLPYLAAVADEFSK